MGLRNVRSAVYLRFVFPIEARLLARFGHQEECGCETLWGFKRIYCVPHAFEDLDIED